MPIPCLGQTALAPRGRYLNVATGPIDPDEAYLQLIGSAEKKEMMKETIEKYEEMFQVFLSIAFLLLAMKSLVSE